MPLRPVLSLTTLSVLAALAPALPAMAGNTEPVRTFASSGTAVVLDEPGSVVVSGDVDPSGRPLLLVERAGGDVVVVRLTTSGALDGSFGVSGTAALPGGSFFGSELLAIGDTVVVVGDTSTETSDGDAVVVKLDAAGLPLAGFGDGGRAAVALPDDEYVFDAVGYEDGSLLLAGGADIDFQLADGSPAVASTALLVRVTAEGARDTSWRPSERSGTRYGDLGGQPGGYFSALARDPANGRLAAVLAPWDQTESAALLYLEADGRGVDGFGRPESQGQVPVGRVHPGDVAIAGGLPITAGGTVVADGTIVSQLLRHSLTGQPSGSGSSTPSGCQGYLGRLRVDGTGGLLAVGDASCGGQHRVLLSRFVIPTGTGHADLYDAGFGERSGIAYHPGLGLLDVALVVLPLGEDVLMAGAKGDRASVALVDGTGPAATAVTMAAPTTAIAGRSIGFTGAAVRTATNQKLTGRKIALQRKPASSTTWANLRAAVTADQGTYVVVDNPGRGLWDYRTSVMSQPGLAVSYSAPRRIKVDQVFTAALSATRVKVGTRVLAKGVVNPWASQSVRLERYDGTRWVIVSTKALTTSSYAVLVPTSRVGTWKYRVVKATGGGWATRISSTLTLTVVR